MSIATRLLALHQNLGHATSRLDGQVCQYRMAAQAHEAELRDGVILNPRFSECSSYLPYYAAKPVAPLMTGSRRAGYAAAAKWGASCAVSGVRTDVPMMGSYYLAFLKDYTSAAQPARADGAPRDKPEGTKQDDAKAQKKEQMRQLALRVLPYLPLAIGAWEGLLGTGADARQADLAQGPAAAPGAVVLPPFERLRRIGLLGFGEAAVLDLAAAAGRRRWAPLEISILAVALGVRLVVFTPLRVITSVAVGAVALAGAVVGMSVEAGAQLLFAVRRAACRRTAKSN